MRPARILVLLLAVTFACTATAQEAWFEQTELNPGMGPAPVTLDRRTPMAVMENFVYLTSRGHFSEAAHLMDLSDLAPADQATQGTSRAEQLSVLLERKVVIPWSELADRPDGWISGAQNDNTTGRVRRSILIDRMELDNHQVPLRLNRIKPGPDAEPVWLFSRQSVDNIPRLFQTYGPTKLESTLPAWARVPAFWGMYLWEVIFVPLLLLLAFAVSLPAYRTMSKFGISADHRWLRFVGRASRWPVAIALFATLVGIGTSRVLVVSGLLDAILTPLIVIAYVTAATLALVLVMDEIFDLISQSDPNELAAPENADKRSLATTISAARKFLIVVAVLVGGAIIIGSINRSTTFGLSVLASAGALTIILGFAAREVLGNILASVQIALNRSARIGDQLIFEGHFCTVERIKFTYVQLLVWNGTRLIVPVSYFVKDPFENWSIEDHAMVRPIEMTLAQTADVDALRTAFFHILDKEDDSDVAPRDKAAVHVTGQDAFGIKIRFEVPAASPSTGWDLECRVREALQAAAQRLDRAGDGTRMLPTSPGEHPDA